MQKLVDNVLVEMTNEEMLHHMNVAAVQPEPVPTKEQLLAQLNALSAQIQALE
jgi:hypothetical protein